jgi:diguanylate cyclase (GGDEF)-like protein
MEHMKILIAEDEPAIRNNIVWLLRAEGFDAISAENGLDAMRLAREHLPGLIISDVMMPQMDGHALLAALRAEPLTATIPFIFLSARTDFGDVRAGMNLGADDYLPKPFHRDELLGAIRARLSLSDQRRESTQQLQYVAQSLLHFDSLTNLPNRNLLLGKLGSAINHSQRYLAGAALIVLDIDSFGNINGSLGRDVGDQVLRQIADRLFTMVNGAALVSEYDTIARLGADQFAILLVGFSGRAFLEEFVRDVLAQIAGPVVASGNEIFVTACAGIALLDDRNAQAERLLEQAEVALPQAKLSGPGSHRFYATEMNAAASRRLHIHNELHSALDKSEFTVLFQPQVSAKTAQLVGFEALLRWTHPQMGSVSPAEFVPIAEQNGLIVPIGKWVLTAACQQTKSWLDAGYGPIRIAVNLSVRQFESGDLVSTVSDVLDQTGLPASSLELEITESIALNSIERTLGTLHKLKDLGIALAMDDFGTGYSSLAYLKRFPLSTLKVDQSFVRNITTDSGDAAIARAVIAMAHSFGMSVIAEGVEQQAQLDFLSALGCEEFQGYFYSRPLTASATEALLQKCRTTPPGGADPHVPG